MGNKTEKKLVIFGAGYVGSAVASAAVAQGLSVVALTRNRQTAERLKETGAQTIQADLADTSWHGSIEKPDWVLNCVSSGGGGTAGYQHSYVDGLVSIHTWLRGIGKVNTLIYTSSTSVYPQRSGVVDETASTSEATGNAQILLAAERQVLEAAPLGLCERAVILRLAGIYGPSRHHLLDQLRAGEGKQPLAGRADHRLNLIHRDDIVSAILAVFFSDLSGENLFNLTDDFPAQKAEVVAWLAKRIGMPFSGFSGEAVPGRRPDPPDRSVSNEKIKRRLGWRPRYPDYRAGYEQILEA